MDRLNYSCIRIEPKGDFKPQALCLVPQAVGYSALSASIGSMRVTRRAGR